MKIAYSLGAAKAIRPAPRVIQQTLYKQVRFLENDLHHPSLRAKKYDEARDLWQARINRDWRFYFTIEGDTYRIQNITPHPK
jgi:mRNA interferase RelE/StbE